MWHDVAGLDGTSRLVDYLKDRLVCVPSCEIGALITSGCVRLRRRDPDAVGRTYDLLSDGDSLDVDALALAALQQRGRWNVPWNLPLCVHYEDDDLLVVEKQAGIHVHPLGAYRTGTLLGALLFRAGARADHPWGRWRPHFVQRLDRVTSGLLLVAKSADVKTLLQQRGELRRRYRAMVTGQVEKDAGTIDEPLGADPACSYRRSRVAPHDGGRRAVTNWNVAQRLGDRTLLDVELVTGRTHQIRAHLAGAGHPVVGDSLYSATPPRPAAPSQSAATGHEVSRRPLTAPTIALRSVELTFRHPRSGQSLCFRSAPERGFGLGLGTCDRRASARSTT